MSDENQEKSEVDLKKENIRAFAESISGSRYQINELRSIHKDIFKRRNITVDQLNRAMQDPLNNTEILQQASYIMNYNAGILKEFLNYKSEILTFDHYILPIDVNKYKTSEKLDKAEYDAAIQLEKYNIKFNMGWMIKKILSQGELYIYVTEDKESVSIHEIPASFCVANFIKNSIMRYAIDLSKITDKNKDYFPVDIQRLYERYKKGDLKKDKNLIDKNYYQLNNKRAYCFNLEYMSIKGVPYYSHLFSDLINLEDMKTLDVENAKTENFKLVFQKAPIDDDGNLLMEEDVLSMFHQAFKAEIPSNVGGITTPLDIKSVTLGDNTSKKMDYNNKLKDGIYDDAGINSEIFNGNKSSNEAISLGSVADTLLPIYVLKMLEIWLNEDFKTNSKTKNWKISFLNSTQHNQSKKIAIAKEAIATYFGKKQYLATLGMTPLEAYNSLKYEELSKIGERMLPLMTSHTMSSKDKGRTSNESNPESNTETGQQTN